MPGTRSTHALAYNPPAHTLTNIARSQCYKVVLEIGRVKMYNLISRRGVHMGNVTIYVKSPCSVSRVVDSEVELVGLIHTASVRSIVTLED
jgi:hypothetical protein